MNADHRTQIEALYFELFDNLLAYARCCLENTALAEEAVQETFRIACQRPECVCNSPNPRGWIFITLKYTIRSIKRSRVAAIHILEQYLMTQTNEVSFNDNNPSVEITYQNVAHLEEFKILKELAIEGKSYMEMAAERGITVSACRKRVQRAKEKLQKKLKKCL